jgi:hypothetical protein
LTNKKSFYRSPFGEVDPSLEDTFYADRVQIQEAYSLLCEKRQEIIPAQLMPLLCCLVHLTLPQLIHHFHV